MQSLAAAAASIREASRRENDHDSKKALARMKRWLPAFMQAPSNPAAEDLVKNAVSKSVQILGPVGPLDEHALRLYLRDVTASVIRDENRKRRRGITVFERKLFVELAGACGENLAVRDEQDRAFVRARMEEGLAYVALAKRFGLASADAARMRLARILRRLGAGSLSNQEI